VRWNGPAAFTIGPRGNREIRFGLDPGKEFTADEIRAAGTDLRIKVRTLVDGAIVGGMSYALDSSLKEPPRERPGKRRHRLEKLVRELGLEEFGNREVESVKVTHIIVDISLADPCDDEDE
jgi:hypothetical protein